MPALREIFASFGFDFDRQALDRADQRVTQTKKNIGGIDDGFKKLGGTLKAIGAAIAGAFAIDQIRDQARAWYEGSAEIGRWSSRLRISADDMVAWAGVASRTGANIDDVTDSLNDLRIRARDALTGQQSYLDAFALIGISHEDLQANIGNTTQLMDMFIDRLASHEDAATRAFVADEILSDAGIRMLPAFEQGATAIQRQRREIIRNNRATIESVALQRQLAPRLAAISEGWNNLRSAIALRVAPTLIKLLETGGKIIQWINETVISTDRLKQIFVTLGIAAIAAAAATIGVWGPTVGMFALVAAAIGAVYLIINDLWTTMEGGDSITRRVIDGLLGVGATAEAVATLTSAFGDLNTTLETLWAWIEPIVNAFRMLTNIQRAFSPQAMLERVSTEVDALTGTRGSAGVIARGVRQDLQPVASAVARGLPSVGRGISDVMAMGAGVETPTQRFARRQAEQRLAVSTHGAAAAQAYPELADVFLSPSQRQMSAPTTIDAQTTMQITVNEATDARATARLVRTELRAEQERNLRQIQDTLNRESTP